jgi:arginyl-tRNA--protein-N-Asp/Glu arginylyltransferase
MSYKSRFRPSEALISGAWRLVTEQAGTTTEAAPAERDNLSVSG